MNTTQPYGQKNNDAPKTEIRKTRHFLAAALGSTTLILLCGGFLAHAKVPLALEESKISEDRLAGVFITENYIEPGMPQVDINVLGEIVIKEPEPVRIYGTVNEDNPQTPVSFPELEGFGIYNLQLPDETSQIPSGYYTCDDIFTDIHFTVSDGEEHAEASLYVPTGHTCRYYFNPVYQQADGQLYLVPGNGVSSDAFTAGTAYSQSLAQSKSESFNGTEETEGYRFTVKIIGADAPESIELIFMNQENQPIRIMFGDELDLLFQKDMPQLEIPGDVSYLILRQGINVAEGFTHNVDRLTHTLFDRETESLDYMVLADDSYLHPRCLLLIWE